MTQGKHTPGPLWFDPEGDDARGTDCGGFYAGVVGDFSKSEEVCWFGDGETYYNTCGTSPEDQDARRICAAWNACEGIPTEALEPGVVKDMLEALQAILPRYCELVAAYENFMPEDDGTILSARAAIARATGEKP